MTPRKIAAALLLGSGAWVLPAARVPEWPGFRGPNSNPVSENPRLPEAWSTSGNIAWRAAIPGRGWSSPVVVRNQVLLTTVVTDGKSKPPQAGVDYSNEFIAELKKKGLSDKEILEKVTGRDIELPAEVNVHYWLYCLDLKSGAVRWKREFFAGRPPGGRHRKNSFASETPVTDGKLVYVYAANPGLFAFQLNGQPAWSTRLEALPVYLDFGTGASPALVGET